MKIKKLKRYKVSWMLTWVFLGTSILIFLYALWQSEIRLSTFFDGHYMNYYIASFFGVVFWGTVLRLRDETRAKIVMVVTSVTITLYLLEVILHAYAGGVGVGGMGMSRSKASIKTGESPDLRTRLQVIQDMHAKGINMVPSILPMHFDSSGGITISDSEIIFPLASISNRKNLLCNENGYFVTYESDRFGFNNNDKEWDSPTIDWLLVGDSFAHGACVNPGNNIAGTIKKLKDGKESVINLGSGGNGPIIELATLIEYAQSVKPKNVLWIYYEDNDLIIDIKREKLIPILSRYLESPFTQNLIDKQKEIDFALNEYALKKQKDQEFIDNSRILRLHYLRRSLSYIVNKVHGINEINEINEINKSDKDMFSNILISAKDMVSGWGGQLFFIYLPSYSRYNDPNVKHDEYRERLAILNLVESLNIPIVDIHQEVFAEKSDPLKYFPYRLPGHYTEKGYAEVGKAIVQRIP